jgi:hypothetical protein
MELLPWSLGHRHKHLPSLVVLPKFAAERRWWGLSDPACCSPKRLVRPTNTWHTSSQGYGKATRSRLQAHRAAGNLRLNNR